MKKLVSISDDDLCADCLFLGDFEPPFDNRRCTNPIETDPDWPHRECDQDGYVTDCEHYKKIVRPEVSVEQLMHTLGEPDNVSIFITKKDGSVVQYSGLSLVQGERKLEDSAGAVVGEVTSFTPWKRGTRPIHELTPKTPYFIPGRITITIATLPGGPPMPNARIPFVLALHDETPDLVPGSLIEELEQMDDATLSRLLRKYASPRDADPGASQALYDLYIKHNTSAHYLASAIKARVLDRWLEENQ